MSVLYDDDEDDDDENEKHTRKPSSKISTSVANDVGLYKVLLTATVSDSTFSLNGAS